MIEITSTELRRNLSKYFDLVSKKKETVFVRYRNKGLFALTLEPENGLLTKRTEPNSNYFDQPELQQIINKAEADFAAGKHTMIKDPRNIWESIL
jgi:hypothetical protein